jgi:two-component system sensor histidine kinase DegS
MEGSFDTVPRSDIRSVYTSAQREQGRLFMMRGQLEKLQANQESLGKRREFLVKTLNILEQIGPGIVGRTARETEFTTAQSMVVRIIEAQERERQSLSRRMHDGPAQLLTNLILQAEICQRLLDGDVGRAREELENLKTEVNKTFQRTRSFIADLRPMMLDDLGLVPTLRRYVDGWGQSEGIQTKLDIVGTDHRLASHTEVTIFRAIQQLMENAAQHANPSQVRVTLELDGEMATAVVEDDGVGFDIDEVMAAADERKTIGISSIIDRAQMLGGSLRFESGPGRGTKAILQIPEA